MWAHFGSARIRTQGRWVSSPLRHNSAAAGVAQSEKNTWLRSSKEVQLNWREFDSQSWHERLEKNPSHDIYKANMKVSAQHGKYQIYKKDIMLQYISIEVFKTVQPPSRSESKCQTSDDEFLFLKNLQRPSFRWRDPSLLLILLTAGKKRFRCSLKDVSCWQKAEHH